jgi:hypothetical protein
VSIRSRRRQGRPLFFTCTGTQTDFESADKIDEEKRTHVEENTLRLTIDLDARTFGWTPYASGMVDPSCKFSEDGRVRAPFPCSYAGSTDLMYGFSHVLHCPRNQSDCFREDGESETLVSGSIDRVTGVMKTTKTIRRFGSEGRLPGRCRSEMANDLFASEAKILNQQVSANALDRSAILKEF